MKTKVSGTKRPAQADEKDAAEALASVGVAEDEASSEEKESKEDAEQDKIEWRRRSQGKRPKREDTGIIYYDENEDDKGDEEYDAEGTEDEEDDDEDYLAPGKSRRRSTDTISQTAFNEWIKLLEDYQKAHDNVEVPLRYATEEGKKLGSWVARMRLQKKKGGLKKEQVEQLDKLGMKWDVPGGGGTGDDVAWQGHFEAFLEFKKEHGHARVPKSYQHKDGRKLGIWVKNQRRHYRSIKRGGKRTGLTPERIEKLNGAGFVWDATDRQRSWEEWFNALKEYKAKHGHTRVPPSYVLPNGMRLGGWVDRQRQFHRSKKAGGRDFGLSDKRIALLNEQGFIWDPLKSSSAATSAATITSVPGGIPSALPSMLPPVASAMAPPVAPKESEV